MGSPNTDESVYQLDSLNMNTISGLPSAYLTDRVSGGSYVYRQMFRSGYSLRSRVEIFDDDTVTLLPKDRKKIGIVAFCIILQCIAVFIGSTSIIHCVWSPEEVKNEYLQLVIVVYLYDYQQCGYDITLKEGIQTVQLTPTLTPEKAKELLLKPIKQSKKEQPVSIRLAVTTRKYVEVSILFHILWLITTIVSWIFSQIRRLNFKYLKLVISIFMYSCVFMVSFDVSMAIVYIAHIQQSLTAGMVLRYAGWAMQLPLKNPNQFAGWLPIFASLCWMRGLVILIFNLMSIKVIWFIKKKIRKKEVIVKHSQNQNAPIPDSLYPVQEYDERTLVFHAA